jgi:haloalkane dehalogenase
VPIDDTLHLEPNHTEVQGTRMAWLETGDPDGPPIVFLHGNPTSSYLWRNVLPYAAPHGRVLAPDLVGMGASDPLPGEGDERYRFVSHRRHLDALLEALGVEQDVVLVVHDWGSALGFDWARRHPDAVRGIAYTEAICGPVSLSDWPDGGREVFAAMRSGAGEEMVLAKNLFVERILPASVERDLSEEAMAHYRAPFAEPGERRRPTLTWPRELPFDGSPADVAEVVEAYAAWLAGSDVPKLYLHAEPGFLSQVFAERCRTWPNQVVVAVRGIHFVQEDDPDTIGEALASWLADLGRPAGAPR